LLGNNKDNTHLGKKQIFTNAGFSLYFKGTAENAKIIKRRDFSLNKLLNYGILKAMFAITVTPRFGDMDVLGHINNTVPVVWFELARNPLFAIFDPDMELKRESFPLIMAHTDYDYVGQLYFQYPVEIKAWIARIGTKSFTVYHEAWQQGRLCVKGNAVVVHYDFNTEQTTVIPEDKKLLLMEHLLEK
jgi:acyl-CoA thioester hydrolase